MDELVTKILTSFNLSFFCLNLFGTEVERSEESHKIEKSYEILRSRCSLSMTVLLIIPEVWITTLATIFYFNNK